MTMLIFCILFAVLFLLWCSRRLRSLPPGPPFPFPLFGHLHLLEKDPRKQFEQWRRQYGDVFSLYMGSRLVVVLNGYNVIKDALVNNADVFSDRPHLFITDQITRNKGIVFSSGPIWKEQRKLSLEILRGLSMGKDVMATRIQEEVRELVKVLAQHEGRAVDVAKLLSISSSNNINFLVFGKRFEYDDSKFGHFVSLVEENFRLLQSTAIVNYCPLIRLLPGDPFSSKKIIQNVADIMHDFLEPQIKEIEGSLDVDHDNFISIYLHHVRRLQEQGNTQTTINREHLLWVVSDLFSGGMETTTNSILWTLVYLMHYPEVLNKCYRQITSVVGTDRPPSILDRPSLPYVEATIMETLRMCDISGFGLHHGVTHGCELQGYWIPENTVVIPFIHSVMMEPQIWTDPEKFRPERFLDDRNKLIVKEEFIPMGIGRRRCLGEKVARVQLFLYIATMIQRFHFAPPKGGHLPSLQGIIGLTCSPEHFTMCFRPRDK
ncbi:cytochrome P450 2U1-like isoform X2 [Pomacea canaliculata]|nr:cytochrome P450 2U1-like isoform X2 [Pomacea canaliculata]XP_025097077.1 cytochrome P450 2U1-like isoform X2 [Pomacea canaliculata]